MRRVLIGGGLCLVAACGGSGGSSTTTPTTPTPQANRAPTINNLTFSPTFGISEVTQFNYGASASDPDSDSLSYSWNLAGTTSNSASGVITFTGGGNGSATLTVSDGKGGTTSDSRNFVLGTMAGVWSGTISTFPMRLTLNQSGGVVTGSFTLTPFAGQLDPAAANRIDGNAHVILRCKVTSGPAGPGGVSDFTLDGTMDPSGVKITGGVSGSGFSGQPFVFTK
jgi:hypothetical protein